MQQSAELKIVTLFTPVPGNVHTNSGLFTLFVFDLGDSTGQTDRQTSNTRNAAYWSGRTIKYK